MFTNMMLWKLAGLNTDELEDLLDTKTFVPCSTYQAQSLGWVIPLRGGETLTYSSLGHTLLTALIESKNVPAAAVKTELEKWVAEERAKGRNPSKTERTEAKNAINDEFLARAIPVQKRVNVWIDMNAMLLGVDSSSTNTAELVLGLLRDTLGSLDILPFGDELDERVLTSWAYNVDGLIVTIPKPFELGTYAALEGPEFQKYTADKVELPNAHTDGLIEAGAEVVKLGLGWGEQVEFVLTEAFALNKIKFTETAELAKVTEIGEPDSLLDLDAGTFIFEAGTLAKLINNIKEVF